MGKPSWTEHLFWLFGKMYINFLKGDIKNGTASFNWIKFHVSYKGKLVGYNPPPFWEQVENKCIALFGVFITTGIIYIIISWIK